MSFMPSGRSIGRLVKRRGESSTCTVEVFRGKKALRLSFSNHTTSASSAGLVGAARWHAEPVESVYIPVKGILARTDELKRKLPLDAPRSGAWNRQFVKDCVVFNLRTWNQFLPDFPVARIPAPED
ncbi:MAG: hypothetical protein F4W89_06190 [Acidobacteria bacterium]|nr:hypothetical protein [Acidobacteriota bacterium]